MKRRWTASRANLVATAAILDRIGLVDNTGTKMYTTLRIGKGREIKWSPQIPTWAGELSPAITDARGITAAAPAKAING